MFLRFSKIGGAQATTGTPKAVTVPPVLSVVNAAGHYGATWVNFMWGGASWRLPFTNSVTMPVIPAGTVSYRFEAGPAFDPVGDITVEAALPTVSTWYTYVNSETLPILRQPNLPVTWKAAIGSSPEFTGALDASWVGIKVTMNALNAVVLSGYTNSVRAANNDSLIRTQQKVSVGTLWFKAKIVVSGGSGTLYLEKSTSTSPTANYTVAPRVTFLVPYSDNWTQYRVDLNADTASYCYRLRHPSGPTFGNDGIYVEDIVISPAAADVVITKDMVEHNPEYPSRDDPITFKIAVTNVYAGVPASNISPKLVWRLNKGLDVGVWTNTPMPSIGGNQYQVTLPALDPGEFQYYYRADFTGYAYTGPLYVTLSSPADNEADFSEVLQPTGKIAHERRTPAVFPDFPNSQFFDCSVLPPVNAFSGQPTTNAFDYLSFTITE